VVSAVRIDRVTRASGHTWAHQCSVKSAALTAFRVPNFTHLGPNLGPRAWDSQALAKGSRKGEEGWGQVFNGYQGTSLPSDHSTTAPTASSRGVLGRHCLRQLQQREP